MKEPKFGRNQGEITVQGMILRSVPQGEYDKRMIVLTKEKGRITVFARGARRAKHPLSGKTSPFSFGSFVLGRGSSAYYLKEAKIENYFMEMGQDYERNCYGCYFLEIADAYSTEGSTELPLLQLLYQSLRALLKDSLPNALVRYIFELKVMTINGEYPEVFQCMSCQKPLEEGYFSVKKGGVLCPSCKGQATDGIYIDSSVLYTMQYIISSGIDKLYTFIVKEDTFEIFRKIMTIYRRQYMGESFKSLALLEEMK